MADPPKVSVVIPAYNSAAYTVETVESVLAQTYRDFEVIVVDDGSTDHTREALVPYLDRIQYIYKQNGGACSARNEGIRRAKGEHIACLDCDDLWLPEKLEHTLPVLEQNANLAFVFTACYIVDPAGELIDEVRYPFHREQAYRNLLMENYVLAPTVVMRRSCLEQVGIFDEAIFVPADWDLWLRLARCFEIGYVDKPLSKYRLASNYTLRYVDRSVSEAEYVLEKQLSIANELSVRERARFRARLQFSGALLYLKAGECAKARHMLHRAIYNHPSSWRVYGYYMLSLLGARATRIAVRAKRRVQL